MPSKLNLLGKRFGKLLVIDSAPHDCKIQRRKWKCLCDCGNEKIATVLDLRVGDTKSCGCWHRENSAQLIKKVHENNVKYHPKESSARTVWGTIYKEVSFENFFYLSQLNCFYCDGPPRTEKNAFWLGKREYSKLNGNFSYNGLDRLDSSKGHTIDNVVTACLFCNIFKRERSLQEFYHHIVGVIEAKRTRVSPALYRLYANDIKDFYYNDKFLDAAIKVYEEHYADGDLKFKEFYKLSQLNCYYCGILPNNKRDHFSYNGLDRINSNLPHNYDNLVPSCKWCNFSKKDFPMEIFLDWIDCWDKRRSINLFDFC